jgi:hypothetical protein
MPRFLRPSAALFAAMLAAGCACNEIDPGPEPTPEPVEPTPEPEYDRGYWLSMDLDSAGRPWLAFRENERGFLQVARGEGDPIAWTVWDVDGMADTSGPIPIGGFQGGWYASLVLDGSDVPHVSHWNQDDGGVRYATRAGDTWVGEDVDTGDLGKWTSIGLAAGAPAVAYYDVAGKRLKLAARGASGGWTAAVVDAGDIGPDGIAAEATEADVGEYADLLVDEAGTIWIAYYDRTNGDLKIARGGVGSMEVVASYGAGENVGAWPSLSRSGGETYVAFQDVAKRNLLWGRVNGATLDVTLVDDNAFAGADADVAWAGDRAVVVYDDAQNNDTKIAIRDAAGTWTIDTLRAENAVGFHNNVAIDGEGRAVWSTFDHTKTNFVFDRFTLP